MYILTEKSNGGVYATIDNYDGRKIVQVFEEKDDADRYLMLLESNNYPEDNLEVIEVDQNIVAVNCSKFGYQFTIVTANDFVIPPP